MAAPKKVVATEAKKEEVVEEVKTGAPVPTEKKYRCDFNSWKEYEAYKGPKG